jgi:hypothetical protein
MRLILLCLSCILLQAAEWDTSRDAQLKRINFINQNLGEGALFLKHNLWGAPGGPGNPAQIWVQGGWTLLTIDQKNQWGEIIYAYYFKSGDMSGSVQFFEAYNGLQVGTWRPGKGYTLD